MLVDRDRSWGHQGQRTGRATRGILVLLLLVLLLLLLLLLLVLLLSCLLVVAVVVLAPTIQGIFNT